VAEFYNPFVRTFCRLRAGLMASLDIERRHVRPETPLELLIPRQHRRDVWRRLRDDGLDLPPLMLNPSEFGVAAITVLKTAASVALAVNGWAGLLSIIPLGVLANRVTRPLAVVLPPNVRTVGDLVLCLTSYRDHRDSGYRWSRGDIAWRVRFLVAQSCGLSLDEVREDSSFPVL
jgi:hypothetical protein